uniref:SHSP domain-containing protein n=1 Tax=Parastrongyloides trichosuri TaxID=131310 RepID=A0A0N4ZTQ6_PARTI
MALVSSRSRFENDPFFKNFHDDDFWNRSLIKDFDDWPKDWPRPGELSRKFRSSFNSDFESNWPSHWPSINTIMPRFNRHLSAISPNWRSDPFWLSTYPTWAEPTFKDGVDVSVNVINNQQGFTVDVDAYQFKPEELTVKTLDDTLIIEGKHSDVRDNDNYTKMYFIRKYQLPEDVDMSRLESTIDNKGRLIVTAPKFSRQQPIEYGSRRVNIPIQQTHSRSREGTFSNEFGHHQKGDFHDRMSSGSSGYGHSPPQSNYNYSSTGRREQSYGRDEHRRGMSYDRASQKHDSRTFPSDSYSTQRPYNIKQQQYKSHNISDEAAAAKEIYERNTRYREETFSSNNSQSKYNQMNPEPIINSGFSRERNIPVRFEGDSTPVHNLNKTRSGLTDDDFYNNSRLGFKEYERRNSNHSSSSASRSKSASRMYQSSKYEMKEQY